MLKICLVAENNDRENLGKKGKGDGIIGIGNKSVFCNGKLPFKGELIPNSPHF